MSKTKLSAMIAQAVREMLSDNKSLDIEGVYSRLGQLFGVEVFEQERVLATAAVKQKIKQYIRKSHSLHQIEDSSQLSLLKEAPVATIAVKMTDGGYRYVPMHLATVDDILAGQGSRLENIKNAQASYKKFNAPFEPFWPVMVKHKVNYGEAMKMLAERPKKARRKKVDVPAKTKAPSRRAKV